MRRVLVLVAGLVFVTAALASPPRARVAVRSTSLGVVLVDARGHTLYAYDLDRGRRSACTGACLASWPPFLTSGKPVATGVSAARLGTVKRADGRLQVTFAGHPLYFFASDAKAGDVRGASITHWAALSAAGTKVRPKNAAAPPPPPASTTPYDSGGDGYGY
jgi:predicted lipoprotein with Yx(FWY)xxD motif